MPHSSIFFLGRMLLWRDFHLEPNSSIRVVAINQPQTCIEPGPVAGSRSVWRGLRCVMSNSWRLGRMLGIDVYLHWTFLLLLGWILLSRMWAGGTLTNGLIASLFVIAIFGCVLLHEYGHCIAARRYGIQTRDITILPIGGLARLERMPERPLEELIVALAGPAVNVAIAAFLAVVLYLRGELAELRGIEGIAGGFGEPLMLANIALVVFNLIPAFPMDGGRVLRALLAMRLRFSRATRIAARVGQLFGVLFAVAGLFLNPFLVFIGIFVFLGAKAEADYAERHDYGVEIADDGTRVHTAPRPGAFEPPTDLPLRHVAGYDPLRPERSPLLEQPEVVTPDTPLAELRAALRRSRTGTVLVVDGGRVRGVLTREALARL